MKGGIKDAAPYKEVELKEGVKGGYPASKMPGIPL